MMDGRSWLAASLLLGTCVIDAAPVRAQDYPAKEIRVICNFTPGSTSDVFVRFYAERLNLVTRQNVKVENIIKNNGTDATLAAAKAKPDGYTILITPANATIAAASHQFKKLKWDPDDFAPVTTIAKSTHVLVVDPRRPIKTLDELTAYEKSRKDDASYGATPDSVTAAALYNKLAGIQPTRIAGTVAQPLINDLWANDADYLMLDVAAAVDLIKAGKLRALAVSSAKRSPALPDVPTMEEAGLKTYGNIERWWAVFAPAKTPQPVIEKLEATFNRIVESEESKKFLANLRVEPLPGDAKSTQALLDAEVKRWGELARLRE